MIINAITTHAELAVAIMISVGGLVTEGRGTAVDLESVVSLWVEVNVVGIEVFCVVVCVLVVVNLSNELYKTELLNKR